MSTAILTGQPVPGSSLEADLRSLGFDVRIASDTAAAEALLAEVPAGQRVAVVDARFVGHEHALRLGLTDPRFPLAAIPGAVTARPAARQALARAMARENTAVSGSAAAQGPASGEPAAGGTPAPAGTTPTGTLADRIVTALSADGSDPHRPDLGSLVATVPDSPQARNEARQAADAVDGEAVRLKSAVKARDGFFTTYCISPYSRYIARWCARRGLTPNQVTTASLITALIAAACAATGTRPGFVAAGVLLLASFVLDCTDGQLARYSLQYSTLGAWLDATFDRAKEYAYYAGLALGAARGGDDVWALALGAMVLQTCRHVVDFSFNEANADSTAATANTSPTAALSDRLDSVGWTVWVRRMIVLPIGERWAMIAVLTALTTPRITFYALLIGCAFAATYTTAGRVLRALTRKARRTDRAARALADLTDTGPLAERLAQALKALARRLPGFTAPAVALLGAAAVTATAALTGFGGPWPVLAALLYVLTSALAVARPLKGPLDWLVPPFLRAAEYGTVLALAAGAEANGVLPAAYGLVAAVAYHHYDTVYRIRGDADAPPPWLVRAIGGHEGRTLAVVVLAALLTASQFAVALTVIAVAVALLVLFESIRFWVAAHRGGAPAVHDEGEPA
ncbi:CDP-alcohol phosphatidyltransferase family protein [Streptomyces sp. KMM 9044]|uniref:CDP-alcohol phosphatidyltransferase family protein n=1 Tax=Streptomyces sp. KMM 9044 TaxID=2744474 RepID=UPI00215156A5|nr:CDP-alcohol phosphatidyltransferase family protein [Streptomyces sp. KMM 9044]WAX76766.1 CDP-alcohol phosphatidyltransferase family protein [Streptomyces sp. KMM 9044]